MALEPYLPGTYEKFTCNDGAIIRADLGTPQAFTHYTWHKSGGKLLVCDLQGVRREGDGYYLTDPAIATSCGGGRDGGEQRHWGPSDAGLAAVRTFFAGHKCNEVCREWKRPDLRLLAVTAAANSAERRRYSHPLILISTSTGSSRQPQQQLAAALAAANISRQQQQKCPGHQDDSTAGAAAAACVQLQKLLITKRT